MNVWITEDSMLHTKTKSCLGPGPLVSKKDFEGREGGREGSALSRAERMSEEYTMSDAYKEILREREAEAAGGATEVTLLPLFLPLVPSPCSFPLFLPLVPSPCSFPLSRCSSPSTGIFDS